MFTKSLLVSHDGVDTFGCGSWKTPCRTLRYAVLFSTSGDEIFVDHAQNKPYKECDNFSQSTPVIQLSKSLSFTGVNGTAVIQCRKGFELFIISSTSNLSLVRIVMSNLVLSTSETLIRCEKGSSFLLLLHHCVFRRYFTAVAAKLTIYCSIGVFNCTFDGNTRSSIVATCRNLTAKLVGNTFLASPVRFRTSMDRKNIRWQFTEVLVSRCGFYGQQKIACNAFLAISPAAAIVNVTVELSSFREQNAKCPSSRGAALEIYGWYSKKRTQTIINLNKLSFEDNYCTGAMIRLIPVYIRGTVFKVGITNSVFRNTTSPLNMAFKGKRPSLIRGYGLALSNNTFLNTYKASMNPWFNINLGNGKYLFSQCNFINNIGGDNPYDAVIRVKSIDDAVVIFNGCYFENCQASSSSTQIFAENRHWLLFYNNNTINMTQLNKERSIITFTTNRPLGGARNFRLRGDFRVLCPYGYVVASNKYCEEAKNKKYIECAHFSVSCKLCPRNTYSITRAVLHNNITNQIQCHDCVNGGQCLDGILTAKPNFWGYKLNQSVRFLQCPRDYCCEGNDCESYNSCHGSRTGTICAECPQGMSESLFSTECLPNHKCGSDVVWPLAFCFCTAYLVFFLYHEEIVKFIKKLAFLSRLREENRDPSEPTQNRSSKTSGMLKILFYYYQVVRLLKNSIGSHKNKTFNDRIENTVSKWFNFIVLGISSFECPFRDLHPVEKQVILHSVGYVLLGFLGVLYMLTGSIILLKHSRRSQSQAIERDISATTMNQTPRAPTSCFTSRIASAFTYISLLMYASSAQLCLSLLHCVPVRDNQVLFLDGNVKCYQTFQYFLLAYMFSSILPFCLVPVLGSYLLKFGRIGVRQFCAACIFPLPFCCSWLYLLLKDWFNQRRYDSLEQNIGMGESLEGVLNSDDVVPAINDNTSSILRVLLGPFRSHQSLKWFQGCPIPWEGFLTFRRLALIIVLTFIYDDRLKMIVVLTLCVAILISHMYVRPFHKSLDNLLETISLGTHVVLCGLTLIKSLCYDSEVSSTSKFSLLKVFNLVENILIVLPMAIISFVVLFSLLIRLIFGIRNFMQFVSRLILKLCVRQAN